MLNVITLCVGPIQANCYLLYDSETLSTLIIDPGDEGARILTEIERLGLTPRMILNTHGHGDHIGANGVIKNAFDVPLAIHREDAVMLANPDANLSSFVGEAIISPEADLLLEDGQTLDFEDRKVLILHTPGHSPGGVSFYVENLLFSGDALFLGSVGRSDLPGGSHQELVAGIRAKLLSLPDKTLVYPGHGPSTTIENERRENPFLQDR